MLKNVSVALSMTATIFSFSALAAQANVKNKRDPSSVERPPQFVLLAFDGSKSIDFWNESMAFADTVYTTNMQNQKDRIKFTYFVNPTYYIELANKQAYITPLVGKSTSCIGWSSPEGSFVERIQKTNQAYERGHEIGSHALSHCNAAGGGGSSDPLNGKKWSEENWNSEFSQFNSIFFNLFSVNRTAPPKNFVMKFNKNEIKGFRAPQLATTPGLWPTLKKFNFKYDTSQIDKSDYWPVKANFSEKWSWGGWNIPLARIKIAGSTKTTLNMDYNWYYFHSGGSEIKNITPAKVTELKNQMLDSYKYYFKQNYFGGRAPVQIGHHFSKWNGGAYWLAMKEFSQFVCGKPEVRCVTMSQYVDWLESLPESELNAYRRGDFAKLPDDRQIKDIDAGIDIDVQLLSKNDEFTTSVASDKVSLIKSMGLKKQLMVNFKPIKDEKLKLSDLSKYSEGEKDVLVRAAIVNKNGKEVAWETYKVSNVGTPQQKVSEEPLEANLLIADPPEAHED